MYGQTPSLKPSKFIPSPLSPYFIKVNFTMSQQKVFDLKMKTARKYFMDNGQLLNQPELFRIITMNIDNQDLLKILCELYSSDASPLFGVSK